MYFYPWYFGGDWADGKLTKSTITDPRTIKGLEEVADLSLKYRVTGADFSTGKAAMEVGGAWDLGPYKKMKFQWNIAASPWGTNHAVPAFFDGFSVGASPNSKLGWSFIQWMFADTNRIQRWMDAASSGGTVPTLKKMQARYLEVGRRTSPGINLDVCVNAMEYATPMILRYSKNWPKIDSLIIAAWNTVTSGKKSAKAAMEGIDSQVDRLIKTGGTR